MTTVPSLPSAAYPSYMRVEQGPPPTLFTSQSVKDVYAQSHPYDPLYLALGPDMRVDELAHANTYMNLIFGGTSSNDIFDLAYKHVDRQLADSPVEKDSTVSFQNPLKFIPNGEADKDSILQTFAEQRQYYKGAVVEDAERFLKSRPTHNLIATTFYNKRATPSGQSTRYNHVSGIDNSLDFDDKALENFYPWGNLSSRTFAPDGKGGRNPVAYDHIHGPDARSVPLTPVSPIREFRASDLGMYHGNELDQYKLPTNTSLQSLFENKPRF